MEEDLEMDQVLQCIRGLFVEGAVAYAKKENASQAQGIDGVLFPFDFSSSESQVPKRRSTLYDENRSSE